MSNNIVQFSEEIIKGKIKELVRGNVEETLNELLEAEAEKLTQAACYERSEARQGYRSGRYDRKSYHHFRGCNTPCASSQGHLFRDCHHRALSPPGEQRGRSPHRDVSGRCIRASGRGYYRGSIPLISTPQAASVWHKNRRINPRPPFPQRRLRRPALLPSRRHLQAHRRDCS